MEPRKSYGSEYETCKLRVHDEISIQMVYLKINMRTDVR